MPERLKEKDKILKFEVTKLGYPRPFVVLFIRTPPPVQCIGVFYCNFTLINTCRISNKVDFVKN